MSYVHFCKCSVIGFVSACDAAVGAAAAYPHHSLPGWWCFAAGCMSCPVQKASDKGSEWDSRGVGVLTIRSAKQGHNTKPHVYVTNEGVRACMLCVLGTCACTVDPSSSCHGKVYMDVSHFAEVSFGCSLAFRNEFLDEAFLNPAIHT